MTHELLPDYQEVMNTDEFREFITSIWKANGKNYLRTSRILEYDPNTIRRVVNGGESPSLRKKLGIKKSNRVRINFECTLEERDEINSLCKEDGIEKKDLLPIMVRLYKEHRNERTTIS